MAAISFTGLASGIDSKSLISSILDQQRRAQVDPIKTQNQNLTDTNDAFSKLKDLLNSVKTSAEAFRTITGGGIDKGAVSSDETVATATVSKDATVGTTQIAVSQLATSSTASFSDRFASGDTVINSAIDGSVTKESRAVTVSVGQGSNAENVSVYLDNTTTAQGFVTSFNSSSTKAQASLVNVGTSNAPNYAIVIASKSTGTDNGSIAITTGSEVTSAGTGALNTATATVSQAQNAIFNISGVSGSIQRSNNDVSDLLAGVTFHLGSVGKASISIAPDKEAASAALGKFVSSYNDVINYLSDQNKITSTTSASGDPTNTFAPLASTRIDESAVSAIRTSLSSASLSGGLVNTFADLGVTTQRDGTLKFDQSTFSSALSNDSSAVDSILTKFGDSAAGVDGSIAQYTRFGGLLDQAIQNGSNSITAGNNRINDIESGLSKQQDALTAQFSRLESLISQLNNQSQSLTSLLPR